MCVYVCVCEEKRSMKGWCVCVCVCVCVCGVWCGRVWSGGATAVSCLRHRRTAGVRHKGEHRAISGFQFVIMPVNTEPLSHMRARWTHSKLDVA